MKIYQDNGYLDFTAIRKLGLPFNFITGGRATGKTYNGLDDLTRECSQQPDSRFLLMRRTQTQLDLISKPEYSPFKILNRNNGTDYRIDGITKYNGGIYFGEEKNLVGYTAALSTIANVRGFDGSDIDYLLYDEFIPEPHARPIKDEAGAFLNAYETINRNRELEGRKPLQVFALRMPMRWTILYSLV